MLSMAWQGRYGGQLLVAMRSYALLLLHSSILCRRWGAVL